MFTKISSLYTTHDLRLMLPGACDLSLHSGCQNSLVFGFFEIVNLMLALLSGFFQRPLELMCQLQHPP